MKRYLFLAAAIFSSPAAFADSNDFLSDAEESVIPYHETSDNVLVMSMDEFEAYSETPAMILAHGEIHGRPFLLVERNGKHALLTDPIVVQELSGIYLRVEGKNGPKEQYCSSSCLDDAASKGFWGSLEGAGKGGAGGAALGGGIGWYVGGPPGAAAGAAIGGTAGAAVGGIGGAAAGATDGYNTCQKEQAQICGDSK